jgi:hypothetical protein
MEKSVCCVEKRVTALERDRKDLWCIVSALCEKVHPVTGNLKPKEAEELLFSQLNRKNKKKGDDCAC